MSMNVIELEHFGDISNFKLKTHQIPVVKEHEVRIKIKAIGFNPVDYKIRTGLYGGPTPCILGADCSGIIDAIGSQVQGFQIGDEVMALVFGQGSNGTYAEYVSIHSFFVVKKPVCLTLEQAAAVPLAALTAYRCLKKIHNQNKENSLFIAGGSGGVGSLAINFAKALGYKKIYTIARSEESIAFLEKNLKIPREYILHTKNLSLEAMKDKLISMNKGMLFSYTFDFIGKEMKKLCALLTSFQGHMVTITPEEMDFSLDVWTRGLSFAFQKSLSIHCIFIGSESFSCDSSKWIEYQSDLNAIARLYQEGYCAFPEVTTIGGFSKEAICLAHQELEKGHVKGKLVMTIT